jgi:glycosyltransferase involved in cell wall biosynthesis
MILSIIVPVYNVEKYLAKCLESLLEQGLSNEKYEILIINDGSTDSSGEIANDYAKKYSHIKVINQENTGLGAARNTGITHALGKYIQFVDSDDYLEKNVLLPLLDKMDHESLDMLRFNYQNVNEKYEVIQPCKNRSIADYSDKVCDGITFLSERLGYACYACQFIIKTELLKKSGNGFRPGIYFEDTEWTPRILVQTKRITSVNSYVYNYLMRKGSITKNTDDVKMRKWLNDKIYVVDCLLAQKVLQDRKEWFQGMIALTVHSIITFVSIHFYAEKNEIIKKLKQKKVFPLSIQQTDFRKKARIWLLNISPRLYGWAIHIKNKG